MGRNLSAHTPGLAKDQWHRVGWVDGCLYLVLHTVFLSISSWKDAPAFVPNLVRDVLQPAKTMTNSGMVRSGLSPDPNCLPDGPVPVQWL